MFSWFNIWSSDLNYVLSSFSLVYRVNISFCNHFYKPFYNHLYVYRYVGTAYWSYINLKPFWLCKVMFRSQRPRAGWQRLWGQCLMSHSSLRPSVNGIHSGGYSPCHKLCSGNSHYVLGSNGSDVNNAGSFTDLIWPESHILIFRGDVRLSCKLGL